MIFREEVICRYLKDKGVYPTDIKLYNFNENCISYSYIKNNDRYLSSISKRIYLKYYREYKLEEFLNYV